MLSWFSSLLPDRGLKEDCSMVFNSLNPWSLTHWTPSPSLPLSHWILFPQWAPKSGSMTGRGEGGAVFNKSPQRFVLQVMVELPWTFGEVGGGRHRMSIPEALGWGHEAVPHSQSMTLSHSAVTLSPAWSGSSCGLFIFPGGFPEQSGSRAQNGAQPLHLIERETEHQGGPLPDPGGMNNRGATLLCLYVRG